MWPGKDTITIAQLEKVFICSMGYDLSEYNPSEQGMYIFIPYDALEKERVQQLGIQKGIFFLMAGPRQNR